MKPELPEPRQISPKAIYTLPEATFKFGFVDEEGALVDPKDIIFTYDYSYIQWLDDKTITAKVITPNSQNTEIVDNLKNIVLPEAQVSEPPQSTKYKSNGYALTNFSITIPKYYTSISIYDATGKINEKYPLPIYKVYTNNSEVVSPYPVTTLLALNKKGENIYSFVNEQPVNNAVSYFLPFYRGFRSNPRGVNTYSLDPASYFHLTQRKVTESFKSPTGATIPPPPNFEEGRKTKIDSNDFTYTQSGTLPKSYKGADGKTYFLKGWYKGKTKPDTLSTGTPTYKVTYDDNDDLNVVYEETYQFGFVNEAGKLVNPADINITYDYKNIAFRGTGGAGSTVSFDTIATNQSAATVGNLKNVTMPATSIARPTETGWNGEAYSNLSIKLPRYFQSLNLYDKTGKINPSYPLPVITNSYSNITNEVQDEASVINSLTVTQRPDQSYTPKEIYSVVNPSVKYPEFLRRIINSNDIASGRATYLTLSSPVYYHLTNRKVTENFVDTSGAKLPSAPTGFTQGKQTVIDSDPYTFTQSGTLPKSYKGTDGKTYVLKGWYKGKTKPSTLRTDAPSYPVTFDDNDDLNVVYEERVAQDTWIYPGFYAEFVDEQGKAFEDSLTFSGNYTQYLRKVADRTLVTAGSMIPMAGTKTTLKNNQYKIGTQTRVAMPADFDSQTNANYDLRGYTISDITITNDLKYVDKIETTNTEIPIALYPAGLVGVEPVFNNGTPTFLNELDKGFKKGTDNKFAIKATFGANSSNTTYPRLLRVGSTNTQANRQMVLTGFDGTPEYKQTMNYRVTRKKVTEKFVNPAGAPINPPTGYAQNKQTPMTSNDFTFTQAGTLPASYKGQDGKTYIFQGWYKGKTKPSTLKTTKTPSYPVTFDGNDDLNVVYEAEPTMTEIPEVSYQFGFVNEAGNLVNPTNIMLTYDFWYGKYLNASWQTQSLEKGLSAPTVNSLKELVIPKQTVAEKSVFDHFGPVNITFKLPKYYEKMSLYNSSGKIDSNYPLPALAYIVDGVVSNPAVGSVAIASEVKKLTEQEFVLNRTRTDVLDIAQPSYWYSSTNSSGKTVIYKASKPFYYHLTNRKVTEKFVNPAGAPINPPTGYAQNKQTPMTSNTFTFTQAGTLPPSYKGQDGKTYIFKGWYKGKTKPSTLKTTKTPSYPVTFDGDDDLNVVYEEGVASVAASLKGMVTVMPSGGNQMWNMTIKNTGTAPLTDLKIIPTANWSKGLANPKQLSVRLGSGPNQLVSVTAESWANGANLGVEVPVGGTLTVSMTTLATGKPMEVLQAEVALSGNMPTTTVSDTVRIEGSDQEVTDPVGEGFISLPTFDFGQVSIAGATTQHGLKKAADYYGNGTRNPFVRIKKSQPNWSLTAQLSQPKSAKDSLPTATRLLLGQAAVSKVDNYNLVTEMLNPVGTTPTLSLTANNSVTNVITNKQFTGNDVYHLDFNFNNVKLEVPANQGTKGEQYNATVTWNLVTGP
ncbi:WxL domain-containing protein [Enterococcus faecalis]|nr:WxL domain-containing protein [Enterococcus faecalis]